MPKKITVAYLARLAGVRPDTVEKRVKELLPLVEDAPARRSQDEIIASS